MFIHSRVSLQHLNGTIQDIKQTLSGMPYSGYVNTLALVSWDIAPNKPQWCDVSVLKIVS